MKLALGIQYAGSCLSPISTRVPGFAERLLQNAFYPPGLAQSCADATN